MPRLFTAIELSAGTKAAVGRQQEIVAARLQAAGMPLRLTLPGQLHLTLVFIGQVDESRAGAIREAMAGEIPLPPFDLEFGPAGVFPLRGRARVVWLGLSRGGSAVAQVQAHVAGRLGAAGVAGEERPYTAHLTIGRWRDGEGPRHLDLPPLRVDAVEQVRAVTLFESRLRPGGAEHLPLLRCRLGAAPDDPLH